VHVDLFLSSDQMPMGARDPFLDPETCTDFDGEAVPEETWIFLLTALELEEGYRCGGTTARAFPDATTEEAPPLSYDILLDELEDHEAITVVLEARYFPNVSHAPEVYAAEILERWAVRDLDHHLVVASDRSEVIAAIEARSLASGIPADTRLVWPRQPAVGWTTGSLASNELAASAGWLSPTVQAADAGADGLILGWGQADRAEVQAAQDLGLTVGIQVGPGATDARQAARWSVDELWSPELSW